MSLPNPQASPLPKPSPYPLQLLDFPGAIQAVKDGSKVTKVEWGNPNIYIFLHDLHLRLHKEDGKLYDLIVTDGDLFGEDWVVVG